MKTKALISFAENREADLRLCFCICKHCFSHDGSFLEVFKPVYKALNTAVLYFFFENSAIFCFIAPEFEEEF